MLLSSLVSSHAIYIYVYYICNAVLWHTMKYHTCHTWMFLVYTLAFPCHKKYSGQHKQSDIRAAHDGKAGCYEKLLRDMEVRVYANLQFILVVYVYCCK